MGDTEHQHQKALMDMEVGQRRVVHLVGIPIQMVDCFDPSPAINNNAR